MTMVDNFRWIFRRARRNLELTGDVNRIWEQFLVFTNAWASRFLCLSEGRPAESGNDVSFPHVSRWGVTSQGNQNLSYFLSLNVEELPRPSFPEIET